jgi:chromosome segregation ATPase
MARTYSGSEIVTKVLQATKLIEKGTPSKEVWNKAKITRQTYNRWKEICDSIYSHFKAQMDNTSEKLTSSEIKMQQLVERINTANMKLKDARNQIRNLKSQHEDATLKLGNASGKLKTALEDLKARLMTRANNVETLKTKFQTEGKRYHELLKEKLTDCSQAGSCNNLGSWVGKVYHNVADALTKHETSARK